MNTIDFANIVGEQCTGDAEAKAGVVAAVDGLIQEVFSGYVSKLVLRADGGVAVDALAGVTSEEFSDFALEISTRGGCSLVSSTENRQLSELVL